MAIVVVTNNTIVKKVKVAVPISTVSSGAFSINNLTGVDTTGVGNGDLLVYDASSSKFLADSDTYLKAADSAGIKSLFSAGGDLSYDSAAGQFSIDVESVYTKANFDSDLGAATITSVGALNSGSITSGFGSIDVGADSITTTGVISGGQVVVDNITIDANTIVTSNNTNMILEPGGNGDILLKPGGQVGIGDVNSPDTSLHIKQSSAIVTLQRTNNANTPGINFQDNGGTARAKIFMDGTSGTNKEIVFQNHDGSLAEKFRVTLGGAKVTGTLETDVLSINSTAVTSTAAELNILDGVTSTASELNILDGVTSTATELNLLDGVTSTTAELNILDGDTSASSVTVADADRVVLNDNGTMKQVAMSDINTYVSAGTAVAADDINAGDAAVTITTSAGDITIDAAGNDTDIIFKGTDGGVDTAFLTLDGSAGGAATFNSTITVAGASTFNSTITAAGTSVFTNLDISGNVDIDGSLETDDLSINGVSVSSTAAELNILDGVTSTTAELNILDGVTSTTAELNILDGVTSTAAELNILDGVTSTAAELNILDGVTSTAAELNILDGVTATAAEINILDGDTSASSVTVVDADRIVMNDDGTMKQVAVTDLAAYFDDEITAMANLVTVGALNAGSITSGFGAIDNGTSGIRTATFVAETAYNPDANDGATLGTTSLGFADAFLADGGTIQFGNDQDVTLTHIPDTGLRLNSTMALQFNDASQFINAPSATVLDITATDEVEINATLADINANLDVSGTYTGGGLMTTGGNIVIPDGGYIGAASDTDAIQIEADGDVVISQDLSIAGNLTVTGTTTQVDTVTMNASNAVVFEGATADNNETTLTIIDPDADRTIKLPNQSGTIPVLAAVSTTQITSTPEELNILDGVTSTTAELNLLDGVTSTTAELNIVDGNTSATSTTVADADRVVFNDAGTMKQVAVTDLSAYFDDKITAMPNLVSTGALDAGSITSGFGSIDVGSDSITTTGVISAASLDISGNVDIDGTLEADAITVDGTTLAEFISDTTGAMVGSNTESGITVTYQDADNTIDFAIDAAQTGITSLLATDIKIGEDDQTKIDFETADEIHFYAANAHQIKLVDGAIVPVTDNDIDLGTSSLEFKDAYFDGTVTSDAFAGPLTGDVTGNVSGTAATVTGAAQSNITSLGTLTTLTVDNVIVNGTTIGHTDDTDLITLADGIATVAGEISVITLDIGGTNVTSTAAELNILDGVTSTAAELNILDGVTATAAELNILDGDTSATSTTVADADRVVLNDNGTMKQVAMTDINAYVSSGATVKADDIQTGDAAVTITTSSGNITIDAAADDTDIIFKGTDGGVDTTFLTIDGSAAGKATFNNEIVATALDISGDVDIDGTLETDALTIGGVTLAETISDTVGAMVGSNTETGITVTYQDGDNTLDFALGAAQTTITSLLATDIKIGEDDQTKIDFETADEIHFYAANAHQIKLVDGALVPVTDNDIDLGTSSLEFKDAFFDGTVTSDAFAGPLTGDVTGNVSGTAATVTGAAQTNITSLGTLTALTVDDVVINGATIGHGDDTDLMTVADGILTVAGEVQMTTLDIGGTNVTATAAELNILDGDTSATSTTVADADRVVLNDNGTMKQVAMTDINAYVSSGATVAADDINAGDAAVTITTSSGNITIDAAANDTDIIFKGTDGGADTTFLTIDGSAAGAATFNDKIIATELDISGNVDIDGTLEADAITVNGVTLAETISDTVGAMVGSNTETGIAVTYQDGDNTIDFALDAAQTTITSLLATDIKIGEDDQTKIDFETADEIHFYAANAHQIKLVDGALVPVTDNDIDLGTSSLEFKDAFFDGTVTSDAFAGPLTGDVTGNVSGTAATVTGAAQSAITSLGTLTTLTVDNVIVNGTTIGHTDDNDLMTLADGVLTVAGQIAGTTGTFTNTTTDDTLLLTSTDSSSTAAPVLTFKRNSASVADADYLGQLKFKGENDADQEVIYAKITAKIDDASDGSEDGLLEFTNKKAGSNNIGARLKSDKLQLINGTSLEVDAGISVDNITIDGTEIDLSSGDLTLDVAGDIILDADGGDIVFKDGGTGIAKFSNSSTDLQISVETADKDIKFTGTDGSSGITALTLDMSAAGAATFNDKITAVGTSVFTNLDISGDVDVDGTLETDALSINGTAVTSTAAELNILDGVTSTAAELNILDGVTSTAAELNILDGVTSTAAELNILDGVTATAAEINLIDGGTSRGTTAVASGDGILINDGGTMRMTNVDTVSTYFSSHNVGGANIVTTGALNSGSITSGFGNINNGSSTITTTGAVSTGTLAASTGTFSGILKTDDTTEATSTTDGSLQTDGGLSVAKDIVAGDDIKLLSDASVVAFGADGDVTLTHVADTGLLLNGTSVIQFNDASQNIGAPSNTILDINATDEIELNATLVDINANVEISGNLTVAGTTTQVDTVTMNAQNAVVFEGATADDHETTLTIVDPTGDRTINLPNVSGTLPVLAAASTTQITSTPEELNILDGVTSTAAELNILDGVTSTAAELNILDGVTSTAAELNLLDGSSANSVVNSKAVVYGSSGELAGTLSTAAQGNVTSLGTLTTLTVDDITINGSTISDGSDLTLDLGGNLLVDVDGGIVRYYDDGTEWAQFKSNSQDVQIISIVQDKDIVFRGNDGGSYINALTLDMSAAGAATFNDKITAVGTSVFTNLDISGDVDVDGTLEADAITLGGTSLATSATTDTTNASNIGSGTLAAARMAAAQTAITSILATDVKIGEDDQTKIDFETADEIHFYAANAHQIKLVDGALVPATDNDVDLGTSSLEFKNAYFDGTVTSDAFAGPLTGDVTGNVSGSAATVTGAAQSAITSLGTLSTLTVDDITINGSTISDGGDFTLDVGGGIVLDADDDGTISFKDGGTRYGIILGTSSDMIVQSMVSDKDLIFKGNDGGSAITALTLDMSQAGRATFNEGIVLKSSSAGDFGVNINTAAGDSMKLQVTDTGTGGAADGTISLSDGDLTLDVSGDINIDAGGAEINFKDDGTAVGHISMASSNFEIKSKVNDKDIIFKGVDNSSEITALTLDMSAGGNAIFNDKIIAVELDISGNADIDGTMEADAYTVDGVALSEFIADTVGAMVSSNTESGITVAYQDADNTLDFTVGTLNQNTTGSAATLTTGRTIGMTGDVVWTSASFNGSGNVTGTSTIQAGAVEHAMLAGDAVDGDNIADDAINSEHYVDGSIDTAHIAADAITGAKIADNAINSEHYTDGSIDTAHIGSGQITAAKMAVNSINSDQYVDGSIDHVHLSADCVDKDNLASLATLLILDSAGSTLRTFHCAGA